jgi:hypothetical protein
MDPNVKEQLRVEMENLKAQGYQCKFECSDQRCSYQCSKKNTTAIFRRMKRFSLPETGES